MSNIFKLVFLFLLTTCNNITEVSKPSDLAIEASYVTDINTINAVSNFLTENSNNGKFKTLSDKEIHTLQTIKGL